MTEVLPGIAGPGAVASLAGEQFTAPAGDTPGAGVAGEQFTLPGADGIGAVGVGADDVLPFTGSVFTLPIALLGIGLTIGGWFLTRFSIEAG